MYECVGTTGWQISSVYDLATWKNGLAFKSSDFSDFGLPIIKISELKNGFSAQTARTAAKFDPSVFVQAGDMLFSWSGNPDTSIDVFRWEHEEGWLNQHIFKVTPRSAVSEDFLFFLLRWLRPRFADIARNKQTTGLGHVTIQDLKRMMVGIPSAPEQDAIVSVIGPIQSKIELNRKMNEALEAMARALFRDWFVDFGPTHAKMAGAEPYLSPALWSLFPDRLDDGGKPEGWEFEAVIDQADWINGAAYKNMHFSEAPEALPVIKIAELKNGVTGNTQWTATDLGPRYLIDDGELLFSWSGNPDTSIDTFLWSGGKAWLNQHIFAVRENGKRSKPFLHAMLKFLKPDFAELARNRQTTGLGHVTKADMQRMLICTGTERVHQAFDELITPIFDRAFLLQTESRTLAQTRDLLLPRLMSGELRLAEAERRARAVA